MSVLVSPCCQSFTAPGIVYVCLSRRLCILSVGWGFLCIWKLDRPGLRCVTTASHACNAPSLHWLSCSFLPMFLALCLACVCPFVRVCVVLYVVPIRVYVGSINFDMKEDQVKQAFLPFGPIRSIDLAWDNVAMKHKVRCILSFNIPSVRVRVRARVCVRVRVCVSGLWPYLFAFSGFCPVFMLFLSWSSLLFIFIFIFYQM